MYPTDEVNLQFSRQIVKITFKASSHTYHKDAVTESALVDAILRHSVKFPGKKKHECVFVCFVKSLFS